MTPELAKLISYKFDNEIEWSEDYQYIILYSYNDIADLIENVGNSTAKYIMNVIDGDEIVEYLAGDDEIKTFVDDLPNIVISQIKEHTFNEYPETCQDEYNCDEADDLSVSECVEILSNEMDDMYHAIRSAVEMGHRYGTENEMMDNLKKAVLNPTIEMYDDIDFRIILDTDQFWDNPCYIAAPIENIFTEMKNDPDIIDELINNTHDDEILKVNVSEPHYGYNEYDLDAAIAEFYEVSDISDPALEKNAA